MKKLKLMIMLCAGALMSACANIPDNPSRAAPFSATTPQPSLSQQRAALPRSLNVAEINVVVPYSLNISEGNGYYPYTDIVWRGDPEGDRRVQIKDIFETAFRRGTRSMKGETPIILDVELKRFHSVTDRTRLSVGGVHNIIFDLTIRDARTGAVITPPREVEANLKAYGGIRAIKAEQRGQTQKVRVTGFLARVIQQELGQPFTG